jgi:hypothetical protein
MDFKKQNNLTNKMEKSFKDYDSDNNMTTQAIIVNTPEELQELFDDIINHNYNNDTDDFINNECINTYTYWKKEWKMGDHAELTFDYQIKRGEKDYDFCEVYYKENGRPVGELIQEHNQKHNTYYKKYNIYYCDNESTYLVAPGSYQDNIFQKIIEGDNAMGLCEIDVDSIFQEYQDQ